MCMNDSLSEEKRPVIGVLLEGKQLQVGRILGNRVLESSFSEVNTLEREDFIIHQLIVAIEKLFSTDVEGIGIGVPSLMDIKKGIVYNPGNIPSWKEVHLKEILTDHFKTKVHINNDANCFAYGEKHFGQGRPFRNIAGIFSGTGIGVGLIIDNKLYSGVNCGAGEFGSIPFLNHNYEYYCTLRFFEEKYGLTPDNLFRRAERQDKIALTILEQFGINFGCFINAINFIIDPELIVVGGPIARFYPYFIKYSHDSLKKFPYPWTVKRLRIEVSNKPENPILGAAALFSSSMETLS